MVDFTDPYYAGGLVVLTKKDGPIKTLKDMDGRKVSVQVGTKSVNYLKEHFPSVQRVEVEKNQEMFSLVQIGRAEAAVTGKPAAKLFAQSTPDLTVLTEQVTTEEYGIAVPKNKPELTRDLNAALAKLKADGSYQAIVNKWFEAPRNEPAFGFSAVFADFDALLRGALVSIEVTAGALLVGCVVGLLVGVGRLNPQRRVIYNLCSVYLLLFRGTPCWCSCSSGSSACPGSASRCRPSSAAWWAWACTPAPMCRKSCAAPSSRWIAARPRRRARSACPRVRPCASSSCRRRWCA